VPWNAFFFPPAMRRLSEPVRLKAIAIANALLEQGMAEGRAIRIAIARAKQWARRRGIAVEDDR
jgi:uncharacterized protein YdaT